MKAEGGVRVRRSWTERKVVVVGKEVGGGSGRHGVRMSQRCPVAQRCPVLLTAARRVVLDPVMAARRLVSDEVADGAAEDLGERNDGQKPAEGDAKE